MGTISCNVRACVQDGDVVGREDRENRLPYFDSSSNIARASVQPLCLPTQLYRYRTKTRDAIHYHNPRRQLNRSNVTDLVICFLVNSDLQDMQDKPKTNMP